MYLPQKMFVMGYLFIILIAAGYCKGQETHNETTLLVVTNMDTITSGHHLNRRHESLDHLYYISYNLYPPLCGGYYEHLDIASIVFAPKCENVTFRQCCATWRWYRPYMTCPAPNEFQLYCKCGHATNTYKCGCNRRYLECKNGTFKATSSTTEPQSISINPDIIVYIVTGVVIFIVITIVIVYTVRDVQRRRQNDAELLKRKIEDGILLVHCNVLIVVDDIDQVKLHTKRLMDELQKRKSDIEIVRISTYDVILYNYEIQCDCLLLFHKPTNDIGKDKAIAAVKEKVHFRNCSKDYLAYVMIMEPDFHKNSTVHKIVNNICLVPSIDHIEGWLPAVIKALFKANSKCVTIFNRTYSIKEIQSNYDSEYNKQLRKTVEHILASFGATKASGETSATYRIAFLHSMNDYSIITDGRTDQPWFIFVSAGVCADRYKQIKDLHHVYGRNDLILGMIHLLLKLNIISYKSMPSVKAIRCNPLTRELA